MATGLLVFHIVLATALIGIILLQRSEGGGLGTSSSTMGGFMTTRGTANLLTRTTGILAGSFFATTIVLALLFKGAHNTKSILDDDPLVVEQTVPKDIAVTLTDPIQDADEAMSALDKNNAVAAKNSKIKLDKVAVSSMDNPNDDQSVHHEADLDRHQSISTKKDIADAGNSTEDLPSLADIEQDIKIKTKH